MSLRVRYILFISLLHLVIIFLTFKLLYQNKIWFIASEALLLISLYLSVQLYQSFIRPLRTMLTGVEAIRDQDFSVKFRPVGQAEMDQLIGVYNTMIDHLRQERTRLAEQHVFLEKLIQASPIAVVVLDFDQRITNLNQRAHDLFGLHENEGLHQPLNALQHPLIPNLLDLPLGESRTVRIGSVDTYKIQRFAFMDRGFQRPFLLIEELSSEILEAEKKAYGKVIRMMAHEVNNSIGAINSILDTTAKRLDGPEDQAYQEALRMAIERNERLNLFMRRFADIVRLPQPQREKRDMNAVVSGVVQIMQSQAIGKGIELTIQPWKAEVWKQVDVAQFEQVLLNVIKNALEACTPGKCVEIDIRPNRLLVRNNGAPIPPEVEARLFSPFFSTKPDGQGIGLTLIRDILLHHNWKFSLGTREDGWTVFEVVW